MSILGQWQRQQVCVTLARGAVCLKKTVIPTRRDFSDDFKWSFLDSVDMQAEFCLPCPTFRKIPQRHIRKIATIISATAEAIASADCPAAYGRAWKFFFLLPRLLLQAPTRDRGGRRRGSGDSNNPEQDATLAKVTLDSLLRAPRRCCAGKGALHHKQDAPNNLRKKSRILTTNFISGNIGIS